MTPRSSDPAATTFESIGVSAPLVEALTRRGFSTPLPIQSATLPDTLSGRDVLGRGRTGSGKTLAFSIPLVDRLARLDRRTAPGHPAGLVLAPTRELATQIAATLTPLTAACGLRVVTIFGGVPQSRQVRELRAGADIVVACPGRLEDLIKQGLVTLDQVLITVLDEADHMADLGFLPGVTRILAATPPDGQRMLFSATLDNGVNKLVQRFLRNPLSHSVDEAHSPVPAMTHHVFEVTDGEAKRALVQTLASGTGRRILFMRTKHHARRLARQLTTAGIPAADLHGNLSQVARDRNLAAFADGSTRVLVATDIAARGVHVDDVELVVHVDPPAEHKAYLHRSGRTARAGSTGDVVTIMLPEQRKDVSVLLRKAGLEVRPQQVTSKSEPVSALVGTVAPLTAPPAPKTGSAEGSPGSAKKNSRRGQGNSRRDGTFAPAGEREPGRRGRRRPSAHGRSDGGARSVAPTYSTGSEHGAPGRFSGDGAVGTGRRAKTRARREAGPASATYTTSSDTRPASGTRGRREDSGARPAAQARGADRRTSGSDRTGSGPSRKSGGGAPTRGRIARDHRGSEERTQDRQRSRGEAPGRTGHRDGSRGRNEDSARADSRSHTGGAPVRAGSRHSGAKHAGPHRRAASGDRARG